MLSPAQTAAEIAGHCSQRRFVPRLHYILAPDIKLFSGDPYDIILEYITMIAKKIPC